MADTPHPAPTWLSTAEAATRLKVSTRTIARRIAAGELRTQRTPDGRVLVAVELHDQPVEVQAVAAVQATAEGSRQAALALADALPALQRAYEAATLAAGQAAAAAEARAAAAARDASRWRLACLTACLPGVMAVAGLLLGRAGDGQPADTMSATPEPPVGAMVAAEDAVGDTPSGWRPPMLP
jgi:excisionase family DNA binding protein